MTDKTDTNQAERPEQADQAKRRKRGRPYTFHQVRGAAKLARALQRRGAFRVRW